MCACPKHCISAFTAISSNCSQSSIHINLVCERVHNMYGVYNIM